MKKKTPYKDITDLDASFSSTSSTKGRFEVPPLTLESSVISDRKFVVCRHDSLPIKVHKLPHPNAGSLALYQIDERSVSEVLQIDGERSCFYGESVIKDCVMTMLSPIHPFFIVVPAILKTTGEFTLEDLTAYPECPSLSLLSTISSVKKALKLACDSREDGHFIHNESKLLDWMERRFNILLKSLTDYDGVPNGIKESEDAFRHFAFDIFTDYVPKALIEILRSKWRIEKPQAPASAPASENKPTTKRKKKATTNKNETKRRKVLADASKGTTKLNVFFNS